jgi:hypothetical protein
VLSLRELERAAAILAREIVGHRIQQVVQTDETSVVLELYGAVRAAARREAIGWRAGSLSCDPERARVGALREAPERRAPAAALRAVPARAPARRARSRRRAARAASASSRCARAAPRAISRSCSRSSGARAISCVLDAGERIALTLRPLAETRPELAQGEPWQPPGRTLPRAGEDRFAAVADADYLEAIEAHYAERGRESERGDLRRRVAGALRKEAEVARAQAREGVARARERRGPRSARAPGRAAQERQGTVKRGDREVIVRDWDSGADGAHRARTVALAGREPRADLRPLIARACAR